MLFSESNSYNMAIVQVDDLLKSRLPSGDLSKILRHEILEKKVVAPRRSL